MLKDDSDSGIATLQNRNLSHPCSYVSVSVCAVYSEVKQFDILQQTEVIFFLAMRYKKKILNRTKKNNVFPFVYTMSHHFRCYTT